MLIFKNKKKQYLKKKCVCTGNQTIKIIANHFLRDYSHFQRTAATQSVRFRQIKKNNSFVVLVHWQLSFALCF